VPSQVHPYYIDDTTRSVCCHLNTSFERPLTEIPVKVPSQPASNLNLILSPVTDFPDLAPSRSVNYDNTDISF
jgi:hypothetical protein